MAVLLCSVGILLLELGLHFIQIAIVFALFVSSRVFASLVLWISLSHVILAYIFIVLTAYFFVLWVKRRRGVFFIVMLACAIVATFNREEAYTLPVVLPLLWLISSPDRAHWREVLLAAVSLFAIVCFHYWLWHFLIPEALSPHFTLGAAKMLLRVIGASWLPGGYTMIGRADKLIGLLWVGFLIALVLIFLTTSRPHIRLAVCGRLLCRNNTFSARDRCGASLRHRVADACFHDRDLDCHRRGLPPDPISSVARIRSCWNRCPGSYRRNRWRSSSLLLRGRIFARELRGKNRARW